MAKNTPSTCVDFQQHALIFVSEYWISDCYCQTNLDQHLSCLSDTRHLMLNSINQIMFRYCCNLYSNLFSLWISDSYCLTNFDSFVHRSLICIPICLCDVINMEYEIIFVRPAIFPICFELLWYNIFYVSSLSCHLYLYLY